jgi:GntR family transcriptional regulator/MocR family aminotransferase
MIDLRGDPFMEQTLAEMISNGGLHRHIKKANKIYADRCALTCRLLTERLGDKIVFKQPLGGLAVWIKFNKKNNIEQIIKKAAASGLYVISTIYIKEGDRNHNGLRFGFASLTENEIVKAVDILSHVIN